MYPLPANDQRAEVAPDRGEVVVGRVHRHQRLPEERDAAPEEEEGGCNDPARDNG